MATDNAFAVIGVGSPIVDTLAQVDDAFLQAHVLGEKGGMVMVDSAAMAAIVAKLPGTTTRAPGGAAANTIRAVGMLGLRTAFLGKLGNDANAEYYAQAMAAAGVDGSRFKRSADLPNAQCLSLITPDAQRTMRTDLAAAATLRPEEVTPADFAGAAYAYVEGYLLFNPDLAERVFAAAKEAGCRVCLNLGSFEVVRALRPRLRQWMEEHVSLLFANADEARELTGLTHAGAEELARELAQNGRVAAVTDGAAGACVAASGKTARAAALPPAALVDTTGAGDFWAGGFLYALARGCAPATCARVGALLAREIIAVTGVDLAPAAWARLRAAVEAEYAQG